MLFVDWVSSIPIKSAYIRSYIHGCKQLHYPSYCLYTPPSKTCAHKNARGRSVWKLSLWSLLPAPVPLAICTAIMLKPHTDTNKRRSSHGVLVIVWISMQAIFFTGWIYSPYLQPQPLSNTRPLAALPMVDLSASPFAFQVSCLFHGSSGSSGSKARQKHIKLL